jgi:hypothetical protein
VNASFGLPDAERKCEHQVVMLSLPPNAIAVVSSSGELAAHLGQLPSERFGVLTL